MLLRTLISSAVRVLPWKDHEDHGVCAMRGKTYQASTKHPRGFRVRDSISVDDHSSPSESPHQFVDIGESLLYLRQRWRYLSNRIFRLHCLPCEPWMRRKEVPWFFDLCCRALSLPSSSPLRLEAGVTNRDIVSSQHRLGRPRVAENEEEKASCSTRRGAQNGEWRLALYYYC